MWAEALHEAQGDGRDRCYDDYLEEGLRSRDFAAARERIRCDAPCVFPSHPRFVRTGPRTADGWGDAARDRRGASVLSRTSSRDLSGSLYESSSDLYGSACDLSLADDRSGSSFTDAVSGRLDYCLLDALERARRRRRSFAARVRPLRRHRRRRAAPRDGRQENAFWMLAAFCEDVAPWAFTAGALPFLAGRGLDRAVAAVRAGQAPSSAAVRPSLLCAGWLTKFGASCSGSPRCRTPSCSRGRAARRCSRFSGRAAKILLAARCGGRCWTPRTTAAGSFVFDEVVEDAVRSARSARRVPRGAGSGGRQGGGALARVRAGWLEPTDSRSIEKTGGCAGTSSTTWRGRRTRSGSRRTTSASRAWIPRRTCPRTRRREPSTWRDARRRRSTERRRRPGRRDRARRRSAKPSEAGSRIRTRRTW